MNCLLCIRYNVYYYKLEIEMIPVIYSKILQG